MIELADPDPDDAGQCRATLSASGLVCYLAAGGTATHGQLSVPPAEFGPATADSEPAPVTSDPATETPADRQSVSPAAGGRPDPLTAVRWVRCPDDQRLHAVDPFDVTMISIRGYVECLCGRTVATTVEFEPGPSGALCLPCVLGVTSDTPDPGRFGTAL
jgi:hypothetical protein